MQLSAEQEKVYDGVTADVLKRGRKEVIFAGSAGTGKTTLLAKLAEALDDFMPVTWTGKAARRMEEVGVRHAATIHSTIYCPVFYGKRIVGWQLKPASEILGRGFLIDEASTLSKSLYRDLMSYGLPCVFVGDHKQLEPIGDDAKLMTRPHYVLEEIHRNAGDIARFAEKLSRGESASGFKSNEVRLIDKRDADDPLLSGMDQIICAYNRTRVELNKRVAKHLERKTTPEVGDRVICLKNNRQLGLFNGMQGIVEKLWPDNRFDLRVDFGEDMDMLYPAIKYLPKQFHNETPPGDYAPRGKDAAVPFDLAYACTAHKFQGSEADNVLVYAQHCNHWDMARWNYTAASRAKNLLYWAM